MTTNNINGKVYVGKSEKTLEESTKYLGSGVVLKKAIAKYGKENFSKDIVITANNTESLNALEKFFISLYKNVYKRNCYNVAEGGQGGNSHKYKSEKEKIEFSYKMSRLTSGEKNGFFGKTHNEETKKLCGEQNKGRKLSYEHIETLIRVHTDNKYNLGRKQTKETIDKHTLRGERNGMFGKSRTQTELEKISAGIRKSKEKKIECAHCGSSIDFGNYKRWHGDNCKKNPSISQEQILKRSPWNKKGSTTIP